MVEGRVAGRPSGRLGRVSSSCDVDGPGGHATDGVSEPRDGFPLASVRRSIEVAPAVSEDKVDTFPWLGDVSRGSQGARMASDHQALNPYRQPVPNSPRNSIRSRTFTAPLRTPGSVRVGDRVGRSDTADTGRVGGEENDGRRRPSTTRPSRTRQRSPYRRSAPPIRVDTAGPAS